MKWWNRPVKLTWGQLLWIFLCMETFAFVAGVLVKVTVTT